ncbi:GTPase, G3E family [Paucidesulfovibrio gracilis DSM 16080]|uniref:GTPase, G3E family n=1 Tax=Paucidesulfovibrio gracilis DSM 16080 TaxID=1121449 RepID=A0A1T4WNJ6_9BACT|nr:GTP-binding protein [Paucidesulfovibrio gracilis]SKA78930.1 GTPase, G3E family [Paucidesulfovibrio gracilis DSM 16080]
MQLSALLPPQRQVGQFVDMHEMLMNCLLAACRDDAFKRLSGWKGMAVCPRGPMARTLKLQTRPGVFGLCAKTHEASCQDHSASFDIFYFPDPDEKLLECMSLAANHSVMQEEYRHRVRNFSAVLPWAAPFHIGRVCLALDHLETTLSLVLEAPERIITVAQDGMRTQDGQWILSPGEAEEDIPAHQLALDLYLILAASVSHSLGEPPRFLERRQRPGTARMVRQDGQSFSSASTSLFFTDILSWGTDRVTSTATVSQFQDFFWTFSDRRHMPSPFNTALLWDVHDAQRLQRCPQYAHAFDSRPRLIVLSGFLGSGKTTFLNQLLEYHAARDELVAIIQNEVGQTGVDGKLLEGDDSIIEMDEGCVCCTLAGNLSKGVAQLKEQFHPKIIVLESTGLANPFNILNELETLRPLVRLDSITTLVDAVNARHILAASDVGRDQVKAADVLLLNKCDLASEADQRELAGILQKINPRAVLVHVSHGVINPGLLYDDDPLEKTLWPAAAANKPPQHHHDHGMEGFFSRRFTFSAPLNESELLKLLEEMGSANVFRLKGIVMVRDAINARVVQFVSGRYELSDLGVPFAEESFLVAIGKDMKLGALEKLEEKYA